MSYHEYVTSRQIAAHDFPFYGLIMAAIRQADTPNSRALRAAFPDTYREFERRYNAPGGKLENE